jgi:hypothetical protein
MSDRLIFSSERMLHKDYDRKCSIEEKNLWSESLGPWRRDELIGGETSVVN